MTTISSDAELQEILFDRIPRHRKFEDRLWENALGFLMFTVFDEKFIDFADKISNGTKMPRAEWNVLRTYKIAVPTVDVLERFDRIVSPVFSKIGNLQAQITQLRRMSDKLLPRLMSGQLEVAGQTTHDSGLHLSVQAEI